MKLFYAVIAIAVLIPAIAYQNVAVAIAILVCVIAYKIAKESYK